MRCGAVQARARRRPNLDWSERTPFRLPCLVNKKTLFSSLSAREEGRRRERTRSSRRNVCIYDVQMKRQFNETPFETSERTAGCETHGHSSLLLHALVIKMPAQCASETMPWHDRRCMSQELETPPCESLATRLAGYFKTDLPYRRLGGPGHVYFILAVLTSIPSSPRPHFLCRTAAVIL